MWGPLRASSGQASRWGVCSSGDRGALQPDLSCVGAEALGITEVIGEGEREKKGGSKQLYGVTPGAKKPRSLCQQSRETWPCKKVNLLRAEALWGWGVCVCV